MGKLTRSERQWVLYDVGNSAFVMLVTTILPIYFKNMATAAGVPLSRSTAYWSFAAATATLLVAVSGPVLGAVADIRGFRKPVFALLLAIGVGGCAALALPLGWLAFLGVFVLAKVGFSASLICYDAMLVDVTEDDRMDSVSSLGFAFGYIGSCIPFVAGLALILTADRTGLGAVRATVLAILLIAAWWLLCSLPLLRGYRQRHYTERQPAIARSTFRHLGATLREIRGQPEILWFLIAFFFYIDGVHTIIELATSYGKDVGVADNQLLLALLLTQVVAFPCALLFARLSRRFEASRLISASIVAYIGITLFALQLDRASEFWVLAVCVAIFQGGIQALSRSYFARIIPKEKCGEYFGFYDIFGKGASFMGTSLVGLFTHLFGSSRAGVAVLPLLFTVGYFLLRRAVRMAPSAAQEPACK
ncbi:MAG: MFS transporter [Clostridiales bacterium]|nr:MFS transporter [Clostridiales bacterium]